jgi:hypothetical protein
MFLLEAGYIFSPSDRWKIKASALGEQQLLPARRPKKAVAASLRLSYFPGPQLDLRANFQQEHSRISSRATSWREGTLGIGYHF